MHRTVIGTLAASAMLVAACNSSDVLPPGTRDPSTYNTPSGAVALARGTVGMLRDAVSSVLYAGGLLTDELDNRTAPGNAVNLRSADIGNNEGGYAALQALRGQASIARSTLVKYAPEASPALRAEMYALEGYADIYLADMYCSGVPLSTVNFESTQSFTYRPGSSTADVYRAAAALLDTAVSLSHDSLRIESLARTGLGRALLALGQRDSAAAVVATVPESATYAIRIVLYSQMGGSWQDQSFSNGESVVANREGGNGLPFASANDPRVPISVATGFLNGGSFTFPVFTPYLLVNPFDSVTVVVANGIEARLIQAEAQLAHGGTTWLRTLNRLRTDSTFATAVRTDPMTGDSLGVDTTWNAGTGGVAGLRPLEDPGNAEARLSLMFSERGYWLYLSARRQGDLRRLVRSTNLGGYGRLQSQVYPVGLSRSGPPYGNAVTLVIPNTETRNPFFKGCFNHDA